MYRYYRKKDLYDKNGLKVQQEIDGILSKSEKCLKQIFKQAYQVLFVRAFSSGAKAKRTITLTCKMLEDLGTINIASKHPSLLEDLSIEAVIEEDPDYIFLTTMGDTEKAMEALKTE